MKKIYLIVLMLSLPVFLFGQISLNASMAPSHGSMFIYYDANVPSPAFTFSKSGTANTWDFTAIAPVPTQYDTVFIYDPATIPGSSAFPTATHAIGENDTQSITMGKIDATGVTFLGMIGDVLGMGVNSVVPLVPPLTLITFPYTYGSGVVASGYFEMYATGNDIGQPTIDSVHFKSTITSDRDVIAAGNLIIPSGTFPSILEREINISIDSAWMKSTILTGGLWVPAPGFPTTTTDSSFYWYTTQSLQKYAHALFDDTGLHDVVYFKNSVVGINEAQITDAISIYPNPVNNILHFTLPGNQYGEFSILDVEGRELMKGQGNMQQLNVSRLSNGIYFLKITTTSGESSTHRFVKE